jgi:glycosyltransferase involved in cell wall biosynthesis
MTKNNQKIAIVIPCYKVENHIEQVISEIPDSVDYIIAVNDCSPDNTGYILTKLASTNNKIVHLKHEINLGVGGAMVTGFNKAIELGVDIVVKIDGDGQMDIKYLYNFINPILDDKADMTKGNRFRNVVTIKKMPIIRRLGNIGLSFLTKASSGYWNIFDPTNGYLAIRVEVLKNLEFSQLDKGYFFESSLLNELYFTEAVVKDIPIDAKYADEKSNLSVTKVLFEFPPKILKAIFKRLFYKYFFNDFSIGSIYLIFGVPIFIGGIWYGLVNFIKYVNLHQPAPTGTVIIPTLLITLGFQLLLSFVNFDVSNYPKK